MHPLLKSHLEKKEFNHAYLIIGDLDISREMTLELAQAILNPPEGRLNIHPDFFYQKFDLFGINNSRDLIYKAFQKPLLGENKVFIIETFSFTPESSNALLKILEEPFEDTQFFFLTPSINFLAPTLYSRLTIIDNSGYQKKIEEDKIKLCNVFLSDLPTKRLLKIKAFEKDKQKAIEFLNDLEVVLSKKLNNKTETSIAQALEEIQRARNLLLSRVASVKMIMEHLALALPQV